MGLLDRFDVIAIGEPPRPGDLLVVDDWPSSSAPPGWTVLSYAEDGRISCMYRLADFTDHMVVPGQYVLRPKPEDRK